MHGPQSMGWRACSRWSTVSPPAGCEPVLCEQAPEIAHLDTGCPRCSGNLSTVRPQHVGQEAAPEVADEALAGVLIALAGPRVARRCHLGALGQDRALDGVEQLADVARPGLC